MKGHPYRAGPSHLLSVLVSKCIGHCIIQAMTETSIDIRVDQHLDAKGLNCPLPVLKAKVALNKMLPGEVLHVEATDPHATIDFEAYCARSGHKIIRLLESDELIEIYICRAVKPKKI